MGVKVEIPSADMNSTVPRLRLDFCLSRAHGSSTTLSFLELVVALFAGLVPR